MIDWQITYPGPGVSDVAYFLCQSMAVEERRTPRGDARPRAGTTARRPCGARRRLDDYPFALAWDAYRRTALFTTVYPVTAAGPMDPANERGRELVTAMAVRSFTACLDLDSAEFLE